ncbi:MAG: hypothetical protein PF483_05470 [Halothiobacillus sp.]|nr:hypothetical protein [Halothiobacillus sp.]
MENDVDAAANGWYQYWPEAGYIGHDHFVMQVDKGGLKVRIHYQIEGISKEEPPLGICDRELWKISSASDRLDSWNQSH